MLLRRRRDLLLRVLMYNIYTYISDRRSNAHTLYYMITLWRIRVKSETSTRGQLVFSRYTLSLFKEFLRLYYTIIHSVNRVLLRTAFSQTAQPGKTSS